MDKNKTAAEIWNIISEYISNHGEFKSVNGIRYKATIKDNVIHYKGGEGNRGLFGEEMSKREFLEGYNAVKDLEYINTSNIRGIVPSSLYAKRSPFVGLLSSCGII
ncbi:hypothetical protein [Parabacteroides sp. PF5-6]|uniref:hypothetical protein n=1 Tax=Parabacteroides sp. PF5-6 TaxID=1742403 RepID=UPI002406C74B|nr:hypothetical protein [Parabacteroides sp. PF5-6]MDF9829756.1 hypothetical protein [Parabacteroides sp. PF5-6]